MLTISLVTLGSPEQLTGGYLYHRRMADLAERHAASMEIVSVSALRRAAAADVVVVDSIAAAFVAPWFLLGWRPRLLAGAALAASLHQPPGGIDHGPVRRVVQAPLDRALYRRCGLLLLASEDLAAAVPGLPVRVVPPGCDVAPPPRGPVPDLRLRRRAAFVSVGNWMARKGTLELLDAFARLPAEAATLHLAGRTDVERAYARRVRARLEQRDLAGRVVVHGPVSRDEVARLYAGADAFVLPSYREPYGTVYGEALAAGLPVAGWRAGNLPNLADHDREGVVLEPGDVAGLAAALERLATDEAYRARLAGAARERGARLPRWDDTAAMFFGALRDLAAGSAR